MNCIRLAKTLRLLAAAFTLALGLAITSASAQETPNNTNADEGGVGQGPVPGYIATGLLSAGMIFVLCKSARR
jgi:hypothetical protein